MCKVLQKFFAAIETVNFSRNYKMYHVISNQIFNISSHIKLLSVLDSSWTVNASNGLQAHGHPHWLQLQHAAAKLLDLALLLPAHRLPQFQMYRWAFVGDATSSSTDNNNTSSDFVPHIKRIAKLMDSRVSRHFLIYKRILCNRTKNFSLQLNI